MSRPAGARLFVAIDPPAAVCAELAAWARTALAAVTGSDARRVHVLPAQALHVTLCFLGTRPPGEIETIAAAVRGCEAVGGELRVGAPLWLPPRRPRALALEVHDRHGELASMHEAVLATMGEAIAWEPERRRFRAHLTVARLGRERSRRRSRAGGAARRAGDDRSVAHASETALAPTPALSFTPGELVLYRSWLSPEGASYEPLASSALSASAASSPESSAYEEPPS
jgi:RNA 2',3'-cyclic 3'-phosphodiesterase